MSSKNDILASIRRQAVADAPLPDLNENWIAYADPERQFVEVLASVGGQAVLLDNRAQLEAAIRELPCLANAAQVACNVPNLSLATIDLQAIDDPHRLADLDVAILAGEFAVAENGAVWLTDRNLRHRAAPFIAQHVVLVVPRTQLVHHLHQAYQRLEFSGAGYGVFISGPSKTADIEQSLVIGAHGPRSLTVMLVGE